MIDALAIEQTTLGVVLLIVTMINGWTMIFVRIWQHEYGGPLWWALMNFLFFASFITAGAFGFGMPAAYAAFANLTYVLGFIVLAFGFYEFFGLKFRWRFYGTVFGLWLFVGNLFAFVLPSLTGRILIVTVITVAISADVMGLIRRHIKPGLVLAYGATLAIFPTAIAVMLLRLGAALGEYGIDLGYTYTQINTTTIVMAIFMTLGLSFGQVLMISARFQTDLRRYADRFKFEAMHDPLTGAGNRRLFMDSASRLLAIRQRHVRPFSLISLDLDNFKNVNDTHGHAVGDTVLEEVSRRIRQNLRSEDIFARIGGEEFAILMPETTLEDARLAAERHRAAIEELRVLVPRGVVGITCSFGVTEGHPSDSDPEATMARADVALYEAKDQGRNRVVTRFV